MAQRIEEATDTLQQERQSHEAQFARKIEETNQLIRLKNAEAEQLKQEAVTKFAESEEYTNMIEEMKSAKIREGDLEAQLMQAKADIAELDAKCQQQSTEM
jgi:hypothetical protein